SRLLPNTIAAPSCQPLPWMAASVTSTAPPASAAAAPRPWVSALASSSRCWRMLMVDTMESRGKDRDRSCHARAPVESGSGQRLRVFARGAEFDVRPALDRQLQVDPRGREVDEFAGGVDAEVGRVLLAEFVELAFAGAVHPARGHHAHGFEDRVHAVFGLQAVGGDVELQHA